MPWWGTKVSALCLEVGCWDPCWSKGVFRKSNFLIVFCGDGLGNAPRCINSTRETSGSKSCCFWSKSSPSMCQNWWSNSAIYSSFVFSLASWMWCTCYSFNAAERASRAAFSASASSMLRRLRRRTQGRMCGLHQHQSQMACPRDCCWDHLYSLYTSSPLVTFSLNLESSSSSTGIQLNRIQGYKILLLTLQSPP